MLNCIECKRLNRPRKELRANEFHRLIASEKKNRNEKEGKQQQQQQQQEIAGNWRE